APGSLAMSVDIEVDTLSVGATVVRRHNVMPRAIGDVGRTELIDGVTGPGVAQQDVRLAQVEPELPFLHRASWHLRHDWLLRKARRLQPGLNGEWLGAIEAQVGGVWDGNGSARAVEARAGGAIAGQAGGVGERPERR